MATMNSLSVLILLFLFTSFLLQNSNSVENKYSKEANTNTNADTATKTNGDGGGGKKVNYRELDKPFRMAKLNLVWHKAQQKLSETKLGSLYTDLQLHDKEEMKLKRSMADGQDKEGLLEAGVRKKFRSILNSYSLLEYFEEGSVSDKPLKDHPDSDNHINKSLFKDKKLNKLWEKAEKSGFEEKELKALKEEFVHHQEKLDEYYYLMESLTKEEKNLMQNDIPDMNPETFEEDPPGKKYESKYNHIKEKQRQLKDGIDNLHKKAASGPTSTDFTEPRVQTLWRLALAARFTPEELASMKTELKHFEKRLQKLQHLQSEYLVKKDHAGYEEKDHKPGHTDKDMTSIFEDKIKRHERTVEKLHTTLEEKIMNRHTEL